MAKRSNPTLANQWLANPSKDLLSGLVVAFAMIPEAIAFSGIAGVDPKVPVRSLLPVADHRRRGWSYGHDHLCHWLNGPVDDRSCGHR